MINFIECKNIYFDLFPLQTMDPQCTNGHLMCAGCFTHLLADARLRDETASCPNCRCVISRDLCSRNLAVEKAVCELPGLCRFCNSELPRALLEKHQHDYCDERIVRCTFARIGCPWRGPHHESGKFSRILENSCIFSQILTHSRNSRNSCKFSQIRFLYKEVVFIFILG